VTEASSPAAVGDDAPDSFTIKVQRNNQQQGSDTYVVRDGTPVVELLDDGDLWITKSSDDGETSTFVTTYARGTWLRAYLEDD
jgi:hypothetical protein